MHHTVLETLGYRVVKELVGKYTDFSAFTNDLQFPSALDSDSSGLSPSRHTRMAQASLSADLIWTRQLMRRSFRRNYRVVCLTPDSIPCAAVDSAVSVIQSFPPPKHTRTTVRPGASRLSTCPSQHPQMPGGGFPGQGRTRPATPPAHATPV